MSAQEFHITVATQGARAIDLLAGHSALPKQRLKDAMNKGAVWLKQGARSQRLRRATKNLHKGDQLSLYYDPEVLQRIPPQPTLLADEQDYSVWDKPAGLLAQGTLYGDHCSLLRWSELHFTPARAAFLIHRLDREAQGLMLIAHNSRAANALSRLWQEQQITKIYRVVAEGRVGDDGHRQRIEAPLDGKSCITDIEMTAYDEQRDRSALTVNLITGRKHQIRRHLASIGHPVVGDFRYGSRVNDETLALRAEILQFRCPLRGRARDYRLNHNWHLNRN